MSKPIVTGAFRIDTWQVMKELLTATAGGLKKLQQKPLAIFDVCPSPPLKWSDLTCQNLIDCARTGIPSQIVSMPLAGATAPVTLAGAVVQHTAECISGITIAQLAQKGAPIVWGGSPAIFDMKHTTTPMGALGTWMIDIAYTQVGKWLKVPTHAYLGMSDAKVVDAQCGLESSGGTFFAALAGVNMVSGAGMMAFENCQSFEKLVLDAEVIGMAKHLLRGIRLRDDPIAVDLIREVGHQSDFITHDHTHRWFKEEFYYPSPVIDRQTSEDWESSGARNSWDRAKSRVDSLLDEGFEPTLDQDLRQELRQITTRAAQSFGMDQLPPLKSPL
jgi:trimethylamine--corrinoid protein Co-methyltransferase